MTMCRLALVLIFCLCIWPYDAWAVSIGPVTCPEEKKRLTPAEFATAGEQGDFADNLTYILSAPGEYKLNGEINANNFSSGRRACFIGSDRANVVIKAATGKWHFNLQDVTDFQLGFQSLTLLGDRASDTGGSNLVQSLIAMEDVIVSNCGQVGVQLSSPPTGKTLAGYFRDITFTGNNMAVQLTAGTSVTDKLAVFQGTTNFLANKGGIDSGPGMYLLGASAVFTGPAIFKDNIAGPDVNRFGGAIAAVGALVSFQARVTFTGNQAYSAGAVFLFEAVLKAADSATFDSNSAQVLGGAVFGASSSSLAVNGQFIVKGNQASSGGAIALLNDSFMVSRGSCVMDGNTARGSSTIGANTQGQLYNTVGSTAATTQTTHVLSAMADVMTSSATTLSQMLNGQERTFEPTAMAPGTATSSLQAVKAAANDPDPGSGGALFMQNSKALFILSTTFSSNKADIGGAMMLVNSATGFREPVTFRGNVAQAAGAVFATSLGVILANDTVLFDSNQATGQQGGAIFLANGGGGFKKQVTFRGNRAKDQGGAIFAATDSLLQFESLVDLYGNSADAGGAIAISAKADVVMLVKSMRLRRNKARNGGGFVSDIGRGNVTIGDLRVIHNTATESAGGMAIGSRLVVTGDAQFTGNTAGQTGGAIFVTASLTLHKACFIGNKAAVGPAMSVAGRVDFDTSGGLQNFYQNTAPNGSVVPTIVIAPLLISEKKASITCDGANPRPRGGSAGQLILVEGPLCDAQSCPPTATNCTCPARTRFMVDTCSCGKDSSANVQVALTATSSYIKLGGFVQLLLTLSAGTGTAATVQLTVDVPKVLSIVQAPPGCKNNAAVDNAQLVCTVLNVQPGQSQQLEATTKAAECGTGSVVANITSPQGVDPQQSSSSVSITVLE